MLDHTHLDAAPPTVRLARDDDDDAGAVARLCALDGRAIGAAPVLVAEAGGEIVAALSVRDGDVVSDPFRFTLEAVAALRREASRHATPSTEEKKLMLGTTRRNLVATVAALVLLCIAGFATAANAAPKPGFLPGTWIGKGTISGITSEGPMTTTVSGGISFKLKIDKSLRASGTGIWKLDMIGAETGSADSELLSSLRGSTAIRFAGTGSAVTFTGNQQIQGEIRAGGIAKPVSFAQVVNGRLLVTKAGKCKVVGGSQLPGGVALKWTAVLKGSGTCRT